MLSPAVNTGGPANNFRGDAAKFMPPIARSEERFDEKGEQLLFIIFVDTTCTFLKKVFLPLVKYIFF